MTIVEVMNVQLHFKQRGTMRNLYRHTMPLWSLVQGIRQNVTLAATTAEGRALLAKEKAEYTSWKPRSLMAVFPAVKFGADGTSQSTNIVGYTGLAGFDFDNVDVSETITLLKLIPSVVVIGVSASGRGVWCFAHIAAATAQEYAKCYAAGIQACLNVGIENVDRGTHDPTRARFVSSDPNCWWREDVIGDIVPLAPAGDLSLLTTKPEKVTVKKMRVPKGYTPSKELVFDEARAIVQGAADVPDGERNNAKAKMCGQLKALAEHNNLNPSTFSQMFLDAWDEAGSTPKKTREMMGRMMLGKSKKEL